MKTIRALRQARGWTQYELALQVGVHPQAVYLWESGRRTPHVPQLRKVGQLFGLCSDEIDLEVPRDRDRQRSGQQRPESRRTREAIEPDENPRD
jgi:transcriptional regulator with XRE-family HTH domain